ncbi:16S rRNA (guanine(527)-N(7))-methyltransferase RsmG [Phytohalomonas tamaricis]|uniref:16S rRNA (guanine(527)-N(7))-methyltransferase RsmG n=1 Tax=Phytohalomonas tamaricis TaxID=2081032 RepID=UPI000D0B42D7|nr:16S rRNA (guanine(527)-N(7))-methyltransferase RsmG [Phytohalomonas tamaricis]
MTPACERLLDEGCAAQGITLDALARTRLLDFLALLHKWNRAYNLTAVRDPETMVSRHLLDSLSIMPWVHGPRVLDVGAGAGLPGLVLAIVMPELDITLLDSNGKKVRFQRQATFELGLKNVTPFQARVEAFEDPQGFDQILSRAFSSLDTFVSTSRALIKPQGEWLAMKGRLEGADVAMPQQAHLVDTIVLNVPNEPGQRHLLRLVAEH